MTEESKYTTIRILKTNRDRLKSLCGKGETYDTMIEKLTEKPVRKLGKRARLDVP
jgi:hypothetical protein